MHIEKRKLFGRESQFIAFFYNPKDTAESRFLCIFSDLLVYS